MSHPPHLPPPYGPPRADHTARTALLIIGTVVVLLCSGLTFGLVHLISSARGTFQEAYDELADGPDSYDYRGSSRDPLTVSEGEGFIIRGVSYAAGWKIDRSVVTGLRASNTGSQLDDTLITLTITLREGSTIVAGFLCTPIGTLEAGESTALDCSGSDVAVDYDSITAFDTTVLR